jgi:hypothetical protein
VQRSRDAQIQFELSRSVNLDEAPRCEHVRARKAPPFSERQMKFVTGVLAAALLMIGISSSQAMMRITDDPGGRIGTYIDRYQALRTSGKTVMIDGLCASACTIVLGEVPASKICVSSRANLGFHAAWDLGSNGQAVTNGEATRRLYTIYPSPIRRWISSHGGLTSQMLFLNGRQLASMYRPCYLDAQASTARQ